MLLHVHTPLLILTAKKIFGLQPRDEAAMLVVVYNCGQYNKSIIAVNTIEFFFSKNYHENGVKFQRRTMLLFLTTNMAAVTSRANQQ